MPRKKKVKEAQFDVEMTKDMAGSPETTTKSVDAADATQALQKAKTNDPQNYDQVSVNQPQKGVSQGSRTSPASASPTQAVPQTSGMGLTEAFDSTRFKYDYVIGLPNGFGSFLKKTKGRTKGLMVEQRSGRIYMTVESPDAMEKLMGKLKRSANSKIVETRDKARTLIRGIVGSMK